MQKFRKLPIKKQLSFSLGAVMAALAILKFILAIVLVIIVTNNINSYAETYVSQQIQRHSEVLLTQSSDLFVTYLQSSSNGFLLPVGYSAENINRLDFVTINDKSVNYFDWSPQTLSQPLEYSTRQSREVSLKNSAYYLPLITDPSTLTAAQKDAVGKTNYLDYIWTPLYGKYTDFTSVYVGLTQDGIFRKYPGVNSDQNDRTYDPRNRGWFKQALTSYEDVLVTSPYDDARGLGRMITFSKVILDAYGQPTGVAGADLLIKTLVDSIQKITLYKTGNVILIQQDKTVIVNKDGDTSFFSIINLNTAYGEVHTANDGNFIYTYKKIQEFGGRYILIVKVNAEEIQAPLQTVKDSIDSLKTKLILLLLLIFVCILVLAVVLSFCSIKKIVKPIEEIMRISDDIINDIGKKGEEERQNPPNFKQKKESILEFAPVKEGLGNLKVAIDQKKKEDRKRLFYENSYFGLPDSEIPWNF